MELCTTMFGYVRHGVVLEIHFLRFLKLENNSAGLMPRAFAMETILLRQGFLSPRSMPPR